MQFAQGKNKMDMVITYTTDGYIKRVPLDNYRMQKRGGRGKNCMNTKENDLVKDVIIANNSLKFLSRYGFNIISIDPSEDRIRTNTTQAKENIKNNKNKTIFVIDSSNDKVNEITKSPTIVKSMTILSEDDIKNNETYETMMNKFIDNLRTEVYS